MCVGCWKGYAVPLTINDSVRKCAQLIDSVYDLSCVGGNCHTVVDDWNVRDSDINWCIKEILSHHESDDEEQERQLDVEWLCMSAMAELTVAERLSALLIQELGEESAAHFHHTGEIK